ncbi:extracellular solute-binding protein [Tropicibacter sp. R15_0]|uniref:ABC transporter substrate-binding protein n=1 Tax=Tropicibacter sp. R15_0 TaxID=2821101 RepID=UPI001ADB7418|nr:extracellular solute-binding protein [Tropicibacter sp. R15_0]MBO9467780.1 extracellular solute-binding protein [Tropicibacter sp. R15_0]
MKLATSLVAATAMTAASTVAAQAETVEFWTLTFSSDKVNNAYAEIEADFEAANPGIDLVITRRGVDEHKTALRVAAGSDKGPDIYFNWAGLGLGGEYVLAGMSQDLSPYYSEFNWDKNLVSAALGFTTAFADGKHGVPNTFKGEVIYYNKQMLADAGFEQEPQSYEELLAFADALAEDGIAAITFGGSVNWHVMRLMDVLLETKCGAEKHDQLVGLELNWSTEPCALESLTEMEMWADKYFLKPFMGIDHRQSMSLFVAGKAAMMLEGNWLVNSLAEADDLSKYGIFPFPTGTGRLYGFAEYHYISSKSANPDAAAKFLGYLLSDDVQQKYLGTFSSNSVNQNVEYKDLRPLDAEWNDIFGAHGEMFVNGDQGFPANIVPEYFRIINEVVTDGLQPQEAADAFQTFIDNAG